jgi:ABC-type transporter Mla subunit MlaD
MSETGPAGSARDPFESIISIVAGPIAAVIRSFDQMRRGTDELINGMENFNRTMQNLNATAERVNALLNEFEQPVRAILPQVTRTVTLAEDLATRISGPVEQVAPGLARLADTLNSPVLTSLPTDLGRFIDAINDLVRRLSPLGQLAESATGLFGLRIPGMPPRPAAAPTPPPAPEPSTPPLPAQTAAADNAPKKKAAAKKSSAKRSAAKKSSTKRKRTGSDR